MTRDLRSATLMTVAFHSLLFFPGWIARPVSVDVQRGPVSFEVELFSEAQVARPEIALQVPAPSANPHDESWVQNQDKPPVQQQPSLDAEAGHGAFIDAQPDGAHNRPPAYPWLARIQGVEGIVMLGVRVERDGRPSAVWIVHSSGSSILDEAAQRAIQQWEFAPAHQGGHAIRSEVELPVRFRLTSSEAQNP